MLKTDLLFTYGSDANVHSHLYWHYTSGPPTTADLTTFSGAVMASWVANLLTQMGPTCSITQVTATDLSNTTTQPGVTAATHAGTETGTPLTADTCMLINLKIGRRYRGGHPRVYMPFGTATNIFDPQHWQPTAVSGTQTKWNTFISSLIGVGPPGPVCDSVVNVSYHSGGALRPTPLVDTVLQQIVSPIPASQRRRMGR